MINRNGLGERDLKTRRGVYDIMKISLKLEDIVTYGCWSDFNREAISEDNSVISGSLKMYNLIF